uniref:Uncharacterized protein n=1 Tax=Cannabis sativa TaxID=3483 RepID=A0A803PMF8_CANSA
MLEKSHHKVLFHFVKGFLHMQLKSGPPQFSSLPTIDCMDKNNNNVVDERYVRVIIEDSQNGFAKISPKSGPIFLVKIGIKTIQTRSLVPKEMKKSFPNLILSEGAIKGDNLRMGEHIIDTSEDLRNDHIVKVNKVRNYSVGFPNYEAILTGGSGVRDVVQVFLGGPNLIPKIAMIIAPRLYAINASSLLLEKKFEVVSLRASLISKPGRLNNVIKMGILKPMVFKE